MATNLKRLAEIALTADARLKVARKMNRYKFYQLALELVEKNNESMSPEIMVSITGYCPKRSVGQRTLASFSAMHRVPSLD